MDKIFFSHKLILYIHVNGDMNHQLLSKGKLPQTSFSQKVLALIFWVMTGHSFDAQWTQIPNEVPP